MMAETDFLGVLNFYEDPPLKKLNAIKQIIFTKRLKIRAKIHNFLKTPFF
jgi:hypothetical protein